ncbi:hypothetical protein BJX63DRAFT_444095 [Aspergillus granulosus]|uniref:Aminoglycoside phosphotransferase domain-containing protein n=1 Tax=Aspergillus granulosus TaxID=176169 RepID=A0ABR4H9C5_9EURO
MIQQALSSFKRKRKTPPRSIHTDWNANTDWFHYTSGRFAWNEAHEMMVLKLWVPNPNAGHAHYTTANEVAAMDFARNELQIPVPKVLAWSSRAEETLVHAEDIIMEKAPGVNLDKVWPKMDIKQRFELVKTIQGTKKLGYRVHGCIQVKQDGSLTKHPRFAAGPSTGREFLDDGRLPLNLIEQYKLAVGHWEIACVQSISHLPRSPLSLYGPGTSTRSRSKKVAAIQNYFRLVKYLLPAAELLPLFDPPYFLDYEGPQPTSLNTPQFPGNFKQLRSDEKATAQDLYLKICLYLENEWAKILRVQASGSPPFLLQFSADEIQQIEKYATGAVRAMELTRGLREELGELWPEKGIVWSEKYDETKQRLNGAKTQLIERLVPSDPERLAWEESWQFDT